MTSECNTDNGASMVWLRFLIISLMVLLGHIAARPAAASQKKTFAPALSKGCPLHRKLEDEQKFSDLIILTFRGTDFDGCVQILRGNQIIFSQHTAGKVVIGNDVNKNLRGEVFHAPPIPLGTDMTGLGKPDLLLGEWSGGMHCCFTFHILELGDRPHEIATVPTRDSDYAHFEDLSHDGSYQFVGWDFTFAYWGTGFMQSPAPRIVLRFNGRRFELAPDLMRQVPPSAQELKRKKIEAHDGKWEGENPPPVLWGTMLDLIYSGHAGLAWKFLNDGWPTGHPGKATFLHDFCRQLEKSPYFSNLRPTIGPAPCRFTPAKGVN